jgi:hypothetical protein
MIAIMTLIAFAEFVIILNLLERPKRTLHDKLVEGETNAILESQRSLNTSRVGNGAVYGLFERVGIRSLGAIYIYLALAVTLASIGAVVYVVLHHWGWT